jgi:hypothetical protein
MAIDPGNEESAYCIIDTQTLKPVEFAKVDNGDLLANVRSLRQFQVVIEMIASYGMAVGKEVFETCVWIGRFSEANDSHVEFNPPTDYIYRRDEKLHICQSPKAKDSNIIQALKDRFGDKGTKKNPGWFYGFSNDIWQAYAVGLTYIETKLATTERNGGR